MQKCFMLFFSALFVKSLSIRRFHPHRGNGDVHVHVWQNVSSNIWQRDLDGAACYKVNRKVKVDKTTRHANVSMV